MQNKREIIQQFFGFLFDVVAAIDKESPILPVILLNLDYFTKQLLIALEEDSQHFQMEDCAKEFHKFVFLLAIGDQKTKKKYEQSLSTFEGSVFETMKGRLDPFMSFINTLDFEDKDE